MATMNELTAALSKPYDGLIEDKQGFSYIPWYEAIKQANRVFGINGYSVDTLKVWREGEGYAALVRVTVHPDDAQPFHRDGVGYNDVTARRDGAEMVDTAIKGAASDALNRALKLFGAAFGLNLYDKPGSNRQASTGNSERSSAAPKRQYDGKASGPTAKQRALLVSKGVDEDEIDAMTIEEASERIGKLLNGGGKASNGKAAAPAKKAAPAAEPDDLDEFFNN